MRRHPLKVMGQLIGLIKPLVLKMVIAILMGTAGNLTAAFIPILGVIGLISLTGDTAVISFHLCITLIIICGVSRGFLKYAEQACNHDIAFRILAIIRHKIFMKLRSLAPAKLEGNTEGTAKGKGNLLSIITSDIELLEVFYAHTISPVMIAILFTIIMVCFMFSQHFLFALIALCGYGTVGILLPLIFFKYGSKEGQDYREEFGQMNSYFLDSIRGIQEVMQFGIGKQRIEWVSESTKELDEKQKKLKIIEGNNRAVTDGIILFYSGAVLLCGLILYSAGAIELSKAIIAVTTMFCSFGPTVALSSLSNNLFHTIASGNRVLDLLEEEPEVRERTGCPTVEFNGASLKDVNFSYNNEMILSNFNIDLNQKELIGIHGKSGSGKSTILKLLMRFWDVNSGQVNYGSTNVKDINTDNLRRMQSYVTQETQLFHDSIANNIAIGKENASREEIEEAAKKASIHEFIMTLPEGYDTNVGELGNKLSGGEKQRIGLARAFLHDAPFWLLDEPTSNLDSLNEGIILKSLKEEKEDKTIVLISHRKSTMGIADCIFEMEQQVMQE